MEETKKEGFCCTSNLELGSLELNALALGISCLAGVCSGPPVDIVQTGPLDEGSGSGYTVRVPYQSSFDGTLQRYGLDVLEE